MNIVKTGTVTILASLLGSSAMQVQAQSGAKTPALMQPPSNVINVTNDLKNRYGELQIAVNPKNPNNLVIAINQMGFTYACKAAKDPNCEIVAATMSGGGGGGGGRGGAPGANAAGRAAAPGAEAGGRAAPGAGAAEGAAGRAGAAGAAAGRAGGAGGRGGAGGFPHPRGFFTIKDFTQTGVFTSFDRGKTWKRVHVPVPSPAYPDLTGWGDPSVAAGPDGTFYLSYDNMDWGTVDRALVKSMVGFSKSTDGGRTWTSPVPTGTAVDSPKTTVDAATGMIYHASGGNRQLVSSKDGVTFTAPKAIGGTVGDATFTAGIGGITMAAAHGAIAFTFSATNANACKSLGGAAPCVVFQTTTDSGATWTRYRVASGQVGAPAVAADPSKKGHFTVAVLSERDSQFQIYQTLDSGKTWTGPTVVAKDPTKQHFHPWVAYSSDGVFGLMWRTRQPVPGQVAGPTNSSGAAGTPLPYNIWAVISRDGGATVSEPLKVNKKESPGPDGAVFGNSGDDYSALALDHGYAFVAWPDWSPGDRSGMFRAIKYEAFRFKR